MVTYEYAMQAVAAEKVLSSRTFCNGIFKLIINRHFQFTALTLALSRDGSSGGVVRLGIIDKDGIERRLVKGNELPRFYEGWLSVACRTRIE